MVMQVGQDVGQAEAARRLYIDLLIRSVGNFVYNDDLDLSRKEGFRELNDGSRKLVCDEPQAVTPERKVNGWIWPSRAHTMIGLPRLLNLAGCMKSIIEQGIEGDVIETGVWRGGATILMRGMLKAYGITDKTVWVADSFEGLPPPDEDKYQHDAGLRFDRYQDLAVSLDDVKQNFKRYDLLDEQVHFLKGWFKDTLPVAPIEKLALIRLDGDLYESTMDGFVNLYHKLSPGGYLIIDDYNFVKACNLAVHDFREQNGITEPLIDIKGGGAFWQKR